MAPTQDPELPPAAPALVQVPLNEKLRNRFYEPLVLLLAATQACMHNLAPRKTEPTLDRLNLTSEELFHEFMNKLAQICDTKRGGNMVTAVVALSPPGHAGVQYRFASNQRSQAELTQLKHFVVDILQTLRDWTEETSSLVKERALRKVIVFNRERLQLYVRAVVTRSKQCLETNNLAPEITAKIENLHKISSDADDRGSDENTFFQACRKLMDVIKKLSRSSISKTIRSKANAVQNGVDNPWTEMRHAAGRLLSYLEGVQTFIEVREEPQWTQLFYDFEVVCIPSSKPEGSPLSKKKAGAAQILNRMASSLAPVNVEDLKRDAEQLQRFGLDANIYEQKKKPSFQPIVHAEVLIHDSLVNDPDLEGLHSCRFFSGYRYIGTSKPTCRLCDYYFRAVGDGVQVRGTHRNLYLNWRTPDVYESQGPGPVKRREDILNNMNKWVRKDTVRTLSDKIGERKPHDSSTRWTYERDFGVECSSLAEEHLDDISSMMGGVSLEV